MKKEEKYTFDLTKIYKNLEEFKISLDNSKKYIDEIGKYVGKLNNKKVLLDYFKFRSKIKEELYSMAIYISLSEDLNINDNDIKVCSDLLDNFFNDFSLASVPIDVELSKLDDKLLNDCILDKDFKNYKMKLESIKRNKVHMLSKEEENVFALMGSFSDGFEEIYRNIMNNDLKFEPVIIDGKEEKLTTSNVLTFYKNPDQEIRKQAFLKYKKAYDKRVNSSITAYIYKLKQTCFDLKLRKYTTVLDSVLESEKIPKEVYYKLIDKTTNNFGLYERFNKIKKKALGLEHYYSYDSYLPISKNVDKNLSIEKQFNIMREALKPLGEKYISNIDLAIKERWFDLYADDENKVNSTYANANYKTKQPFVFMQQNYDMDSLGALIHEFGHAVNFKYSMDNQTIDNYSNSIYNAEIASTVNEVLLANYLYNNAKTEDEKIFYLEQMINNFIGTVMVQAEFSMFEDFAHKLAENNEPITIDVLCNKWYEINKMFNGDSYEEVEEAKEFKKGAGFIAVHHFMYSSYYVFNYATSFTCAYYIASKLLKGDKEMQEKYLQFLAKGGSEYPNEQCEEMGIKLQTGEPYNVLFSDMSTKLDELEALVEKRNEKNVKKSLNIDIKKLLTDKKSKRLKTKNMTSLEK